MGNYEDCIKFLNKMGVELFEYQKEILKAFIENKKVRTARGIGRTFVADCYGRYIAHILSNNDDSEEPDVVFPYDEAVKCGLLSEDFVKKMRNTMTQEEFSKEFLCKNNYYLREVIKMDEFDKCKFCIHYDDYEGCESGCYNHEDYKPDKTKLINKAKEKGISVVDLIALIDLK